jgi:hypothetical protein
VEGDTGWEQINSMNLRIKEGDIIKIPLPDGTHVYARILVDGSYAIYDYKTDIDISDLNDIIEKPILFIASVDIFGIKEGYWSVIGHIPLEKGLKNFYPRFFNAVPTNEVNISFYNVYKNEIEEAIKNDWIGTGKTQLGGIHGRVHIESRIMDYYAGKKNIHNKNAIDVFKKYLGFFN